MKESFWHKDGTRSVLASVLSILIGLVAGSVLILAVGLATKSMGLKSAWEGIRIVIGGVFTTGRDAAGSLTFGFNPASVGNMLFRATPLILTGLSVAVAFKTGLFNIGAPGQYLAGTTATLFIALSVPWRHAGGRSVGRHPRPAEIPAEYQRGAGLHHDQLDCRQCGDLAV